MKLVSHRGPGREPRVGVVVDGRVLDVGDAVASSALSEHAADVLALRGTSRQDPGMLRLLAAGAQGLAAVEARVATARASARRPAARRRSSRGSSPSCPRA